MSPPSLKDQLAPQALRVPQESTYPAVVLPSPHIHPVGGRLALFAHVWDETSTNTWVRSTVRSGLRVPFATRPRQLRRPPEVIPVGSESIVDTEVLNFISQQALEQVSPRSSALTYYHSHFAIPKKESGAFRHIINMRRGNAFVIKTKFKMESLDTLATLARKGHYACKVDIKSAFTHVPIHPDHRDFFRIRWKGQHYRFKAMPFGYRDAPRVFTKLIRAALQPLRESGVVLIAYLDDILVMAESAPTCAQHTQRLVNHLSSLGFDLKEEKCLVHPSQEIDFLGFSVDLINLTLSLPTAKKTDLSREVSRLLSLADTRQVAAHHLQKVLGKLRAAHPGFDPAALYTRALQRDLRSALNRGGRQGLTWLSPDSVTDLSWWKEHLHGWEGKLLVAPPPQVIITTDASRTGWGGWVSTPQQPEKAIATTFGHWTPVESNRSSNWRETMTSLLAIQSFRTHLTGKAILLRSDNVSNVANIMRGGGRTRELTMIAKAIWSTTHSWKCSVRASYRPGEDNQLADDLSRRQRDQSDWMLHPRLFHSLSARWGPFNMDLFATRLNHQIPRYYSRFPDPQAEATDAFLQGWSNLRAYGNPPFALIGRVLRQVEEQKATVVLVVPEWRSAPWWPVLYRLLVALPVRLPSHMDTFRPSSTGNQRGVGLPPWGTICVRLCGDATAALGFQRELLRRSTGLTDQTPWQGSHSYGNDFASFVKALELTPWEQVRWS